MKKAVGVLFSVIVLVIAAGSLFLATCCRAYRIRSGSMEPTVPYDSVVIVLRRDRIRQEMTAGKIYAYQKGQLTVVHRMIGRDPEGNGYIFRGDANNTPDAGFIQESQITGKVILVF